MMLAEFKREVLRKLEAISLAMQEQGSMLTAIMSQLSTRTGQPEIQNHFEFETGLFPMKYIHQLQYLEQTLTSEAARYKLVKLILQLM